MAKSPSAISFTMNKNKLTPCYCCANAFCNADEEFRKRAKSHRTHRCAYKHAHEIAEVSDELKERLNLPELRASSRAAFAWDWAPYRYLTWKGTGASRVRNKEVAQYENNSLQPIESTNNMITVYEAVTEWMNELDDKVKKNALKKFKKPSLL
ncbi:hypothetical protein PMIN03_009162 [Paraphaeosphaeria minitans]